jgi:hypothetical protein
MIANKAVRKFAHNRWAMINIRAVNGRYAHLRNAKSKCYAHVELRMTQEQFEAWCEARSELIESMARPSIDRIDKSGHYALDNIQILELAVNIRKDKTKFVDGKCLCYRCGLEKPEDQFAKDKRRPNGRYTQCKTCDVDRKRKK